MSPPRAATGDVYEAARPLDSLVDRRLQVGQVVRDLMVLFPQANQMFGSDDASGRSDARQTTAILLGRTGLRCLTSHALSAELLNSFRGPMFYISGPQWIDPKDVLP